MTDPLEKRIFDEIVKQPLTYQVTYRISGRPTTTGSGPERYADLVARLTELDGVEPGAFEGKGHTSTSAWIVRFAGPARELFDTLRSAVTARFDMPEVIQVVPGNHRRMPSADLAEADR